jgi:hypothetical protein
MGAGLTEDDLLPTERLLIKKFANLWVRPSEHGLSKFAFNECLGDNEALGGRAYLTNYRILFKSHGFNRLVGVHSLFLPNVVQIRKGWFGITVESRVQAFKFVMWFNGGFVSAAEARQGEMGRDEVERLRQLIQAHPDRLGALRTHGTLEAVNKVLSGVMKVSGVIGGLSSPDQSVFAELVALFSDDE